MADFTKRIIFIILYWILETKMISAAQNFCQWSTCQANEYCCEPNVCCPNKIANKEFYVIGWILAGLIIIFIFAFIIKRKYCKRQLTGPIYTTM